MLLLLPCLLFLPSSRAFIDCSMACSHCQEEVEDLLMREVYCAMCKECRERRRERRALQQKLVDKEYGWNTAEQQDPPPGCPTPPDCDSDIELLHEVTTTPTQPTTCVTNPTPKPACPPIIPCKARKKTARKLASCAPATPAIPQYPFMGCMPCMPMCGCSPSTTTPMPLTEPATKKTTMDFFNLYIGFPKGSLNKNSE